MTLFSKQCCALAPSSCVCCYLCVSDTVFCRVRVVVLHFYVRSFWIVCTNVDPSLIADQRNFKAKYLQVGEEN